MAEEAEQEKTPPPPPPEGKEEEPSKNEVPEELTKDVIPNDSPSEVVAPEKTDDTSAAEETPETPEEEGAQEEEIADEKPVIKIETAPADFRFPTTNQTRHCFTRYIEFHRCVNAKGEGAPECEKFAKYYRSLCPSEWIERWNEQRENGTFPGPL